MAKFSRSLPSIVLQFFPCFPRVVRLLPASAMLLGLFVVELPAAQVRVPEGTLVPLALHSEVSTENVLKGDRVDFDVAEDVVVGSQVVIPKGATAWATVVKIKGAGKKDTKDASVTLHIMGVHAADQQVIPLRLMPNRSKKPDPTDNEIEENSLLPGSGPSIVGAEKGKRYAAYTSSDAEVNAPESPPPQAGASAADRSRVGRQPASPPAPATSPAPEPAAVDFRSDPTGAEVVIDGNSVGITPGTFQLGPGLHMIRIQVDGFQNWQRKMRVEPGSHPTVLAHLVKE